MAKWIDNLDQEQLENANLIAEEAKKAGIPPNLAVAMAMRESSLRHQSGDNIIRSSKGAMGIMQLMPKTAEGLNVDPEDKVQNIRGGVNYIKQMLNQFDNDPMLAAAAYNHGPSGSFFKGGELPEETKEFLKAIKEHGGFDVPSSAESAPEAQEEPVTAWEAAPASGYGNLSKNIVAGGGALAGALAAGTGSAISGVAQGAARTAGEAMARRLAEAGEDQSPGQKWARKTGYGKGAGETVQEVSSAYQRSPGRGKISGPIKKLWGPALEGESANIVQRMIDRANAPVPPPPSRFTTMTSGLSSAAPFVGRVLSGGLGGFGGAMGGMEALERYQQGDAPGAALAGTGALASLGMIPAATAPVAAPLAFLSGLGLGGYDLYKRYKEASKEGEKWARRHPPTEAELREAERPYFGRQRYVSGSDLP